MFWVSDVLGTPITISVNTTWNNLNTPPTNLPPGFDFRDGIIITSGATLTIDNLTTAMQMNANTIISVLDGHLVVNSTTINMGINCVIRLTGTLGTPHSLTLNQATLQPSGLNWQGIELLQQFTGTPSQYQIPPKSGPDGNCSSSQWAGTLWPTIGQVTIINGSKIKDAKVGVKSGAGMSPTYTNVGGVVRVRNSIFENCEVGITILGFSQGDLPNASFVMTSDFIWNNNLTFGKTSLTHIELNQLYGSGLNIGGCHFTNNNTTIINAASRGIGIKAIDSEFSISKDGDKCCEGENGKCPDNCFANTLTVQRGNEFNQLGFGIKFDGVNTAPKAERMACRFADFLNCANGIFLEDARDVAIADNNFDNVPTVFDDFFPNTFYSNTEIFDVTFKKSSGIRIYDNKFEHNSEFVVSIKSEDPDQSQTSFIRKNTFKSNVSLLPTCGPQVIAIDLLDDNNHLDITCNTFINQVYDVKLQDYADLDDIPNGEDHTASERWAENVYSGVPANTSDPVDRVHKTEGCASNIYNETGFTTVSHRRKSTIGSPSSGPGSNSFFNMRFEAVVTYPRITMDESVAQLNCNGDCVDCSTACDKLAIKKVALGIKKVNNKNLFNIYPNPTNGQLTIQLKNGEWDKKADFKIVDLQGHLIYEGILQTKETTLDLVSLNIVSGIYAVIIQNATKRAFSKLIVQ